MSEYYKGMALNWGVDIPSVIEPKADKDVIRSSLIWILFTTPGERVMLPQFGSQVRNLLFQPNTSATANDLKSAISSATAAWEPRVDFVNLIVEQAGNTMTCHLQYRIKSNDSQLQVLSFAINGQLIAIL